MRAIGVREIARWLQGELDREQSFAAGQLATRQYAKRQATWFRHQLPDDWIRVDAFNVASSGEFETICAHMGLT
jgi:tRNA dimethylallyltransferase